MQKVTLDLEVKLKPKEIEEKAQQMASWVIEYDEYEAEKKAQAKELGDNMKELHTKLSDISKVVKRKSERRPVECHIELNTPNVGTKRITRADTGEVIREVLMTDDERQTNLFAETSIEALNKLFELPSEPPPDQPAA